VAVITTIGLSASLFQDAFRPVKELWKITDEFNKPLAVESKKNRHTAPKWWLSDPDPTTKEEPDIIMILPDTVTILLDRRPMKTLEIFHSAKDQRFRDYPPTALLADFRVPTSAEYEVVDLDGDDGHARWQARTAVREAHPVHLGKLDGTMVRASISGYGDCEGILERAPLATEKS
jgi:hypothetical protein